MNDLRRRLAGNMTRMRDAYLEPLNPDHAALEVAREMHSDGELGSHAEDSSNDEVDEILGGAACVRPPREPEAEVSYLLDSSSEDESSQATTEDDTEAPEDPVSEKPLPDALRHFYQLSVAGPSLPDFTSRGFEHASEAQCPAASDSRGRKAEDSRPDARGGLEHDDRDGGRAGLIWRSAVQ